MIRRLTVYLVAFGFVAGLGLCLIADLKDNHHGTGTASTVANTIEFCEASAVSCEDQFGSHRFLLASSLDTEQNTLYKGVSLPPPFPPPRG